MLGKASEIKTMRVKDSWVGTGDNREFLNVDEQINRFLQDLHPDTEIISIQYQVAINEQDYDHNALIIYKEAPHE